jgi:hypothetical protein
MAGFCTKCGSPLADGQGACPKCGAAVANPAARPAQPPSLSPPAGSSAYARPAAPVKTGSPVVKILLIFGVVVLVLGVAGVAGLFYIGHRFKDKLHEMGADDQSNFTYHGPVLGGADPCSLLSKEDVSQVVKKDVVRAEKTLGAAVGCEYNVMGTREDLLAAHSSLVHNGLDSEAQRRQTEAFTNALRSQNVRIGDESRHPGEAAVLLFTVDNNAAKMQMGVMRLTLSRVSSVAVTTIPDIGDDAFDLQNSMMMARKGDTLVRLMYMTCPCTSDDAVSLLKKIVGNISM